MERKLDLKQKLSEILSEIEELIDEDEDIYDLLCNIPDELWEDRYCSLTLIETIFDNAGYISEYYAPCEFIPDSFWDDIEMAKAAIITIGVNSNKFNINEIFPRRCFHNKEILSKILYYNSDALYFASKDLQGDPSIVIRALYSLENKIEERHKECEYNWNLSLLDPRKCLVSLFDNVSEVLKSDKEFILEVLEHNCFEDAFDFIYSWIDENLWENEEFVIEVLKIDFNAIEFVANALTSNEAFLKKLATEIDYDIEDIKSSFN